MFNWDKAVDNRLGQKTDKKQELESLLESLFGQLTAELLTEASSESTEDAKGKFRLPPFKITEFWGQPEKADRERITKFMRNIQGVSFKEKLESVNSIISGGSQGPNTIPQILSAMVFVESLNSIVQEFDRSAAGFLFEAFVAALFGGKSRQIPGTKIQDVIDDSGEYYSLKLIKKGSTESTERWEREGTKISGSFNNLIELFETGKPVHYLVALKKDKGSSIVFGQFTMTPQNFLDVFFKARAVPSDEVDMKLEWYDVDKLKDFIKGKTDDDELPFVSIYAVADKNNQLIFDSEKGIPISKFDLTLLDNLEEKGFELPLVIYGSRPGSKSGEKLSDIFSSKEKKEKLDKQEMSKIKQIILDLSRANTDEEIISILKRMPGAMLQRKFHISQQEMTRIANYEEIGILDLSEQNLKQLWTNYAELLEKTVAPVYRAFDQFSTNLESYLTSPTSEEGQTRKAYGEKAIQSSRTLAINTDEAVTKMEKGRKDTKST
jgi:hypothetical protein